MKHIMCFGDSNTFGSTTEYRGRYDYEDRWTIKLGKLLGEDFHVIEEGLGGRTTVFDDPYKPGKCGLQFIQNCLFTHKPLDLVIIMLGTNDTKQIFNASIRSITHGLRVLVERIRREAECGDPKIMLVSPIIIKEGIGNNTLFPSYDITSHEKSLLFGENIKALAQELNTAFFDAATVAEAGPDNLHMTKESHDRLAKALAPIVRDYLK